MSADCFLTIKSATTGEYKEKGSKFIAFAYPVSNETDIRNIIESIRKEHHSARHHCWAYRIGAGNKNFRANDDGEPANSAGKPILGQIVAFDVSNVLIVVVRYFGGRLLGVGGLIQAYKEAAYEALNVAEIIEYQIEDTLKITTSYIQINGVMKIIKESGLTVINQSFDTVCCVQVRIRQSETLQYKKRFEAIEATNVEIVIG